MEGIFVKLLNMSVSASGFILIAVLLRALLKRSPKWIHCLLWGLVAVRLVCPLSFESSFSLAPRADFVEAKLGVQSKDGRYMNSATDAGKALNDDLDNAQNKNLANKGNADRQGDWKKISWTWFTGVVLLLGYAAISYLRFRKKVQASVRLRDGIYVCDNIRTPFILGVIRPGIYLPSDMDEVQTDNVIAHERAHLSRLDQVWKPLGYCLLAVYWFNPLCWLAYVLFCRDMELACDEKVIRDMDVEDKKVYSRVLLSFSDPSHRIAAGPLAFGEIGVKKRIQSVLNYRKPAFWMVGLAILALVVTSLCFLTNPKEANDPAQTMGAAEYQLPDGLEAENADDLTIFTPNVYKVGSEASCADDKISAGYIQKFNTTDDWGTMKDGKIEQVYSDNHSTVEDYGSIDGLCAPGYLVKVDYDLYSAAALEKEKSMGTDMSEIDTTGQYWLLYLVRENEETGYILALNTKNYTKEDMLAWAQSFQF
jgi:beta-lactamase regulating signal transducer with metallopeptidase domain